MTLYKTYKYRYSYSRGGVLEEQEKLARSLEKPKYSEYIKSKTWQYKKRRLLGEKPKCAVCSTIQNVHIHHKSYKRLGKERKEDLVALCGQCHRTFHELHSTQTVMVKKTNQFIKEYRQHISAAKQIHSDMDSQFFSMF